MNYPQKNRMLEMLKQAIDEATFVNASITHKRDKLSTLTKILISPVKLKNGYALCFVYRYSTKDITKNFSPNEAILLIGETLDSDFYNIDFNTSSNKISYFILPKGKARLKQTTLEETLSSAYSHDRAKKRLIDTKNNIYLRELNITNALSEVRREMSDKYKQINQYIELLSHEIKELSIADNYHVADMGSGKGYLTFALYDYLTNTLKQQVRFSGIEYRPELVEACNSIAKKSNFNNLNFLQGSIANCDLSRIDVLIALHACDTATDDAIFRGIKDNASLIVCAPCCHKQIRNAMKVSNVFTEITKFGILKERQAEIITDTIRALILEAYGYKTKVFEFVSVEHTAKNVMIVGRKVNSLTTTDKEKILSSIQEIKRQFGIEKHYLETQLGL